ncbi:MAG: tetratricopeptide repeat protein [Lachnospiraceae bacterium]|nr:tetratricopeptide repeat protein [Lachnospiraceae bacterium]
MKICSKCGAALEEGDAFCANCGTAYRETELSGSQPVRKADKNGKKVLLFVALALVAAGVLFLFIFFVVRGNRERRISEKLELAVRYLDELDYDRAVAEYRAILDIDPKCVDAYLGMAETYERMGEEDRALDILREGDRETDAREIKRELKRLKSNEEAVAEVSVTPTAAPTPTISPSPTEIPEAENTEWKAAFLPLVEERNRADATDGLNNEEPYALIYLNDDEIPELVMWGTDYDVYVYACVDGEAQQIYDGYFGTRGRGAEYCPRTGYLSFSAYGGAGESWGTSFSFFDGKEVSYVGSTEEYYFYDTNGNGYMDGAEEYSVEPVVYRINGREVSKEEHDRYPNTGTYVSLWDTELLLPYEEIILQLK